MSPREELCTHGWPLPAPGEPVECWECRRERDEEAPPWMEER